MKRILKFLAWTLGSLVLLVVMLAASLYIPAVQRWAVDRLTAYLHEETGAEIRIGSVHLAFPLDLAIGQLHFREDALGRVDVERAVVNVGLAHILQSKVRVREVSLDGCVADIAIPESSEQDTTETVLPDWKIDVDRVRIRRSRVHLSLPMDSTGMSVYAAIREADIAAGDIRLGDGVYRLGHVSLSADSLAYDLAGTAPAAEGLDVNHLAFGALGLQLRQLCYDLRTQALTADLQQLTFREKSGLALEQLALRLAMDSTHLAIKGLDLRTAHSTAAGNANLDWRAMDQHGGGRLSADLKVSVGHEDVRGLGAAYLPGDFLACYPEQPVNLDLRAEGNIDSLTLGSLTLGMPSVFDLRAEGTLTDVADSLQRGADIRCDLATMDLRWLSRYLGLTGVRLPKMVLHADTRLRHATELTTDALLTEGRGKAHLRGTIDVEKMAYQANARIMSLQLHDFLPHDSIYHLTASAEVRGHGTDFLSPRTLLHAQASVDHLGYAALNLDSMRFSCRMEKGQTALELSSRNDLLTLQGCADVTVADRKVTDAAFTMDLNRIDLYALNLSRKPFAASMVMHVDGASDFRQTHNLAGSIQAIELTTADSVYHPLDLKVDARLTPDQIHLGANAGDLRLAVSSDQGLDSLMARYDNLAGEIGRQVDSLYIRQDTLRTLLPHLSVALDCGQRNPICNILRQASGYDFRDLSLHLQSSPEEGLGGHGHIHAFNTGAILLDTIRWDLRQLSGGLTLDARVANGKRNRFVTFQSDAHACLTPTGASAGLVFYDGSGKKGVDVGLNLDMTADGLRAHLTPLNPVIAYRRFTLNADNYVLLSRTGHLDALVDLLADDGTGLKLYTTPNDEAQQDISLTVNHLNVGELTQVMPFTPKIDGLLHGDLHFMQADSTATFSADMVVRDMTYNKVKFGDIGLNATYFPNADGSHYVDAVMTQDGRDILMLGGKYWELAGAGQLDATASFEHMPFAFLNAFLTDTPVAMAGYAWGDMTVSGPTENPILNGELRTDSLHIKAERYNIDLQFPDRSIPVDESRLSLDKIEVYAAGKTPLVVDGGIDFSNLDKVRMDMNVTAKDYQLINAPKRQGALAYGKVFVDFRSRIWGTTSDLHVQGDLSVLGNTDVSCVLTDTPITVDDQLADIVTFCDFSDTTEVEPASAARENIDLQMRVRIADAAQMHCYLSDAGKDYIDLRGGGELTMTYDLQNDLQLWGRYTIGKGTMRYSIMAIPLNDFHIDEGSYVEFQGAMANPRLNIRANEQVRASVTENSQPRNVLFEVGMALSRTLEDMGLEFTLQAPEDMSVQNELTAMTPEERGRVAVTMLVTGMYVTDNASSSGGYNYTNTLNAYLQSAINNIAGEALSTVDLNFGIASGMSESGDHTTDYSFSFAKRFWGNRISVIVGGKVSTGQNAVNTGQTVIDNVSVEYRLDKAASRSVRLFYDRNYESLLEGQVTEMGGGVVFRKKADKLSELFIFRKKEETK